jgi:hypothetical protein
MGSPPRVQEFVGTAVTLDHRLPLLIREIGSMFVQGFSAAGNESCKLSGKRLQYDGEPALLTYRLFPSRDPFSASPTFSPSNDAAAVVAAGVDDIEMPIAAIAIMKSSVVDRVPMVADEAMNEAAALLVWAGDYEPDETVLGRQEV